MLNFSCAPLNTSINELLKSSNDWKSSTQLNEFSPNLLMFLTALCYFELLFFIFYDMNFACWMLLWSVISESTSCQITNVKCLIASASSANKMQNLDLIWDLSVAWLIYHETLLTTYSMENWTYQGLSSTSGLKKGSYNYGQMLSFGY